MAARLLAVQRRQAGGFVSPLTGERGGRIYFRPPQTLLEPNRHILILPRATLRRILSPSGVGENDKGRFFNPTRALRRGSRKTRATVTGLGGYNNCFTPYRWKSPSEQTPTVWFSYPQGWEKTTGDAPVTHPGPAPREPLAHAAVTEPGVLITSYSLQVN